MSRTLKMIIVLLVIRVMGVTVLLEAGGNSREIAKGMEDFNGLNLSDFYRGRFVQGDVFEIYGEFAYTETYEETFGIKHNSEVTAHYYVIPLAGSFETETPLFAALCLTDAQSIKNAELLMEQTWEYMDNGTEPDVWNEFPVTGKIIPMDSEIEGYFYDWFTNDGADGTRADYENVVCPYVISEFDTSSIGTTHIMGIILTVAGFGGIALYAVITLAVRRSAAPSNAYSAANASGTYNPVNAGYTSSFGNTNQSGTVSSPADNGESARLMEEMSRIPQPSDADEFFSRPINREAPAAPENHHSEAGSDMDTIESPALGIGIGDDE